MKIQYTKHAESKFKTLKQIGWNFTRKDINRVIINPDSSGSDPERNAKFASRKYDDKHDLRVIYSDSGGIIIIITFYPTRRSRYD